MIDLDTMFVVLGGAALHPELLIRRYLREADSQCFHRRFAPLRHLQAYDHYIRESDTPHRTIRRRVLCRNHVKNGEFERSARARGVKEQRRRDIRAFEKAGACHANSGICNSTTASAIANIAM